MNETMKTLFLSFDGRISRKPFWIGALGIIVASAVSVFVLQGLFGLPGRQLVYASMAVSLILVWPIIAISTKRLHDRDKPATFWLVIFFGPSFVANIMRDFEVDYTVISLEGKQVLYAGNIALFITVIALVTGIWALIELGLLKGNASENSYGPDPLA